MSITETAWRIETISAKKLVGKRVSTTIQNNQTPILWRSFMPRRKEILYRLNDDLVSMSVYDEKYFISFDPDREFMKWAAVEVSQFEQIPEGMERFELPGGLYAVFFYKGSSTDNSIFKMIFNEWLPASGYEIDARPHFEILGSKYMNADAESEEEIWIPIRNA